MKVYNNKDEWFGKDDKSSKSFTLLKYFDKSFLTNTLQQLTAQKSISKRFNYLETMEDKANFINTIGNIYIQAIATSSVGKVLKTVPFKWLEKDTKDVLKQSVCEAIQHSIRNKQLFERVTGINVSTPNYSFNVEQTNWLMNSDMFGMIAKNAINLSGINKYEWVSADVLWTELPNGNAKIIGKADMNLIKELSI